MNGRDLDALLRNLAPAPATLLPSDLPKHNVYHQKMAIQNSFNANSML